MRLPTTTWFEAVGGGGGDVGGRRGGAREGRIEEARGRGEEAHGRGEEAAARRKELGAGEAQGSGTSAGGGEYVIPRQRPPFITPVCRMTEMPLVGQQNYMRWHAGEGAASLFFIRRTRVLGMGVGRPVTH